MSDDKEVVKIVASYFSRGCVHLDIRIRMDTEWLLFRDVVLFKGDSITISDQQPDDNYGSFQFERIPR